MPNLNQDFIASLPEVDRKRLLANTLQFGYHPETGDVFAVSYRTMQSGTQIIGVTGMGKSSFEQTLIMQEIYNGHCVIVIDPHRDLIRNCISALHPAFLNNVYLLDLEDWEHPPGMNLFATYGRTDRAARELTLSRIGHVFEVQWPDLATSLYLQMYLRMAILPLLTMPDVTMLDLYKFVTRTEYRWNCLNRCPDQDVRDFWTAYESMSKGDREQQIMPLRTRVHLMFASRPTIQRVIGQTRTTLNIRRSIEECEVLFVHAPIRTMPEDAKLLTTVFLALIHEATFGYSDLPEHERPGYSLYVDEAHLFATKDFNQLLTEGRKFGARVVISHQSLGQLPTDLQRDVKNVGTKVVFRPIDTDALALAPNFVGKESRLDSIEPHPLKWLLDNETGNPYVQTFVDMYLRPLQHQIRYGKVAIEKPGLRTQDMAAAFLHAPEQPLTSVDDPTLEFNQLLRQVMINGDPTLPIPSRIVEACSNPNLYSRGFYSAFKLPFKGKYLTWPVRYPKVLVRERNSQLEWTRRPEDETEQLYHFIFHLRQTFVYLAAHPLGRRVFVEERDIARDLLQLPAETAYIRSGDDISVIYTDDTPPPCDDDEYMAKLTQIQVQTWAKYCSPPEPPTQAMPAVPPQPPMPPQPPSQFKKRGQ